MRIFIGSSSEALPEAKMVEIAIREAGLEPVVWHRDVFFAGKTLLETIENIPFDYHAAIILITPDIKASRKEETFFAPVANVIFEYGYLAARLTRARVAICRFGQADLPSDLGGMKLVTIKDYPLEETSALPQEALDEITRWLQRIPQLASGFSPISQVHGYSGIWKIQNNFTLWHGMPIESPDKVTFEGKAFITIRGDGQQGSGSQVGQLRIKIGKYEAIWDIANEIIDAKVDQNGTLTMLAKNYIRTMVEGSERGKLPGEIVREGLPKYTDWEITIHPSDDRSRRLTGVHTYKQANEVYSRAEESYQYI